MTVKEPLIMRQNKMGDVKTILTSDLQLRIMAKIKRMNL